MVSESVVNKLYIGDVIFQLISFLLVGLFIFGIVYLFIIFNRRSKQKIELMKQNNFSQEELHDLKKRIEKIENILKETD